MAQKDLRKGVLITFEGPEGAGKSTQVRLLYQYLRKKGFSVVQLREPGGTRIGEKIRRILLDTRNKDMDIVCEMLLYQAARAQLVKEKVAALLKQGKIVILDRFLDATVTYQGYGAGLNVDMIRKIGALATGGLVPHLTILLDIGAQEGLRRSKRRDRIEKKSLQFHRRVRQGYLKLARENPRRIKVMPLSWEINKIHTAITKLVTTTLQTA